MYNYAAFFSYKRNPLTDHWHRKVCERLTYYVSQDLGADYTLFIDHREIKTGHEFNTVLRDSLAHSIVMIGMWSPLYFSSDWCQAELKAFRDREDSLGLERGRLIAPACVHKGVRDFPAEVERMQYKDFRDYANPHKHFWDHEMSVGFETLLREFAAEIAEKICDAPEYEDAFRDIALPSDVADEDEVIRRMPRISRPAGVVRQAA